METMRIESTTAWIESITVLPATAHAAEGLPPLHGIALRIQIARPGSGPGWESRREMTEWLFSTTDQFERLLAHMQRTFEDSKTDRGSTSVQ